MCSGDVLMTEQLCSLAYTQMIKAISSGVLVRRVINMYCRLFAILLGSNY